MAKISARGAREVLALNSAVDADGYGARIVLCSDGRVLWRLRSKYADGGSRSHAYRILGTVKCLADKDEVWLIRTACKHLSGWDWALVAP